MAPLSGKNIKKRYTLHQVLIHVLSECDLKCKHCYARNFRERLKFNEIKTIMNDSKTLGASLCHLSGGEFFLRKDFKEIINHAHSLFPYVEVTSNGQKLNPDICEFLRDKISKLVISFEGPNAKINDNIRGEGTFEKAKDAILHAKKAVSPLE